MYIASYLFVPGDRPERFAKAAASGAHAVILDLEDAVAPGQKAAARRAILQWRGLREAGCAMAVRINDAGTEWFEEDVALVAGLPLVAVLLPKADSAGQIARLRERLGAGVGIVPIVESARGIERIDEIAQAGGVRRIAFGTLDYAVDMQFLSEDERALIYPSARIAIASRCAGIDPPIAGVTEALADPVRLDTDLAFARAMGFGAKLCIHPNQVTPVNKAFRPTPEEIAWAQRVVAATAAGPAAVQVDGKMVDRPVILKAEAILRRAGDPGWPGRIQRASHP